MTSELNPDEIHFFYACVDEIKNDQGMMTYYRSVINESERQKTDRFVFEKDRQNCLVTRALLRFVLSRYTGQDPAGFEFSFNDFGKPALKPGQVSLPVEFNLSHSGGVTVCALTRGSDIGVDIEDPERTIDVGIAERFFSPSETAYLNQCPVEDQPSVFFDFWTLKEAYIKARGMGLSIALDKFSFTIDSDRIGIAFDETIDDFCDQWRFFRFSPISHFKAAIALRSNLKTPIRLHVHKCIPFKHIERETSWVDTMADD